MKGEEKIKIFTEKYRVKLFSWAFLSAIVLVFTSTISNIIKNIWFNILVEVGGFAIWILLIQLEVNQWIRKLKIYKG